MRKLNHSPSKLRRAREKAGMTRTALAERVGCSLSLISEYESGSRNARDERLQSIAEVLGCPYGELKAGREPARTAAEAAAHPVPQPEVRGDERTDEPMLPELRGTAVGGK